MMSETLSVFFLMVHILIIVTIFHLLPPCLPHLPPRSCSSTSCRDAKEGRGFCCCPENAVRLSVPTSNPRRHHLSTTLCPRLVGGRGGGGRGGGRGRGRGSRRGPGRAEGAAGGGRAVAPPLPTEAEILAMDDDEVEEMLQKSMMVQELLKAELHKLG
jgi:uncharacterized membrane protein YgcG